MRLNVGFVGLGLIGGSLAKALRRTFPECSITAYDTHRPRLVAALTDGTVNNVCDSVSGAFASCDYIFLCAPVSVNKEYLSVLRDIISPDCILTDVGSVKSDMVEAAGRLGLSSCFIGGHPMAGSEKSGYENSSDRLSENIYYILTPSEDVPAERIEKLKKLISGIGSIPLVISPADHDRITAAISHLPHLIAYSLVNLACTHETDDGLLKMLAAGGFKDITRIASSSPVMWQQICEENAGPISAILKEYISELNKVLGAVKSGDSDFLLSSFENAKNYRDDLPAAGNKGALAPFNEIFVDIADESGAIATIATILATNGVNIKNIGIIHNREFQDGVLRIEFYDDASTAIACRLLTRYNYTIHVRN